MSSYATARVLLVSLRKILSLLTSLSIRTYLLRPIAIASAAVIIVSLPVSAPAVAQEPAYTLDVLATTGQKEISLTVPPNGVVPITLIGRTSPTGETIDLHLSEFVSETGGSVRVALSIPDEPTLPAQPDRRNIRITKPLVPINLVVPTLPTAGKYTGRLILSAKGRGPLIWMITLSRAKKQSPAELTLYPQIVSRLATKKFCLFSKSPEDAAFTVTLREKNREWPLENITVSLEQVTKAPEGGFDFNNIDFIYNGVTLCPSPLSREPTSKKSTTLVTEEFISKIPEGEQANIEVKLHDLQAGEYIATLRFRAANSVESDSQKLALTIKVRQSWGWAVIILLIAVIISFIATKGLSIMRQSSTLQKRISELNQAWLRTEPPISSVVWARATLRQAEDLSRSCLLSSPTEIESRLDQVEKLLALLDQIRKLRIELERLSNNPFITRRALQALDRIIYRLGEGPPDEKTRLLIDEKLAKLNNWLDPNKVNQCYGEDLKEAIDLLIIGISPEEINHMKPETAQEIQRLVDKLRQEKESLPSLSCQAMIDLEEQYYARLKILWERREYEEFDKLVEESKSLLVEKILKKVDEAAWADLKRAQSEGRLVINVPQPSGPEFLEAYQPINFSLSAGDPRVDETYLFKHGLEYHWTFTLERNDRFYRLINWVRTRLRSLLKREVEPPQNLTPTSVEPRVVQYAPWPSKLTPSVSISYKGKVPPEEIKVTYKGASLPIVGSRVFHWMKGFEWSEIISLVISIIFGIGTGLATLYFSSETFGSLKDYLTLFLWGAGVDQTKNALQILQTYSAKPVSSS